MGFNAGDTVSAMSTTKKKNKKHRPFKMYFRKTIDQKYSQPREKTTKLHKLIKSSWAFSGVVVVIAAAVDGILYDSIC